MRKKVKLIIEVDEKYYEACKDAVKDGFPSQLDEDIANGIPITDDCISRSALKSEIANLVVGGEKAINNAGYGNFWINGLNSAVRCIDNAPTI